MSARYVYDIYNTTISRGQTSEVSISSSQIYSAFQVYTCNTYAVSTQENRNGEKVTYYTPTGDFRQFYIPISNTTTEYHIDTTTYKYAIISLGVNFNNTPIVVSESYLLEAVKGTSGAFWNIILKWSNPIATAKIVSTNSSSYYEGEELKPFYKTGGTIKKGNTIVSNQSASSKTLEEGPFTSGSTWRWRVYKGSDIIDPASVAYSAGDLYPNEPVTITVTPRPPTYGGTVYYQYQYSTNGTTWANIGSKRTETSATVTIPNGAEQFQARVRASDGWGFTSTTYVTGPALSVSQIKAYATVGGVNRAGAKLYVTVGGKVRKVQKGYAVVDGKVKKLF